MRCEKECGLFHQLYYIFFSSCFTVSHTTGSCFSRNQNNWVTNNYYSHDDLHPIRHHHPTQITFPSLAQTTLKQVKAAIAQSEKLGQIPVSQQRIFHLGRELKTAGRSLETLGVGRLGITILHVHAVPSKAAASSHNKNGAAVAVMEAPKPAARASAAGRRQRQQQQQHTKSAASAAARNNRIVDLAGDSDSDDDCVIVEERAATSQKKRARRR